MTHDYETQSRLVARILRDLLRTKRFETLADLTVALKERLTELKITVSTQDITEAYAALSSNTELAAPPQVLKPVERWREQLPDTPTFNKSEAAMVYRQLMARFKAEQPLVVEPGAPEYFPTLMMVK